MNSTLATRSAFVRQGQRILPEYSSVEHRKWWLAAKVAVVTALVFMSMYTGLLTATGGLRAIGFIGTPIAMLFGVLLWLLPDVDRVSKPPIFKLVIAYLVLAAAWPNYVAIALPGLPWITPSRVILGLMLVTMVLLFSQHAESRRAVFNIVGHDKIALRLYLMYWATLVVTVPLSEHVIDTVRYGFLQELLSLGPMLAVAWALSDTDRMGRLILALSLTCIFTMLVTLPENYMQQPPWLGNIPAFLRVDANLLNAYLSPQARIGDGRYRIRATFGIVIFYSQYLCLVVPLLFAYILKMRGLKLLLGVLLFALILQTVWFSNSRTATLALMASLFGSAILYGIRLMTFRRTGDPYKSMVVLVLVVAAAGSLAIAIASSHRLQMYTIGGKQHAGSDDVRDTQWSNAWNQIARNPIGAGAGNSGPLVGALSSSGVFIVDSYFINLLVDFGPLGFIGFMGCMARVSWLGVLTYLRAEDDVDEWAGPISIALISYIISAYVISNTDNNYIVMIFVACILALHRRQQQRNVAVETSNRPASRSSAMVVANRG